MSLFIQGHPALRDIETAMEATGYRKDRNLLWREYEYADVIGTRRELRTIALAGFAQYPPTYRNACIGVIVSNGLAGAEHVSQHRALGAPLVFEIDGSTVNRWKITSSGDPELKQEISLEQITNAFSTHKAEWEPDRILRAKAVGEIEGPVQLDFYDESLMPFLEGKIFSTLDRLLHEILTKTIHTYKSFNQSAPRFEDLCRLAFRFIAAKVFRDRRYPGGWSSNDGITALRAVERHYNTKPEEALVSRFRRPEILHEIWRIFLTAFSFANLSEDDLALLFEKTFITPEIRRTLGIHSTPLRVAEYMVRKLPFEDLPQEERYVLEPFSGHGRFLVAAMRRMRDLLQTQMSDVERHDYFKRHLTGIEIDSFSLEVSRLSLTLADSPNPNGWRLRPDDVFGTPTLQKELKRAQIVLCNPPFEDFSPSKRKYYNNPALLPRKPAELLRRIMLNPPELLGLVLPRTFESGQSYKKFHRQLAENYSSIELVALPEVFNYSGAVTVLVLASARRIKNKLVFVTCRTVTKQNRDEFLRIGKVPPGIVEYKVLSDNVGEEFSLWVPRLSRVWEYLKTNPLLDSIAEVHRGIHLKAGVVASKTKLRGYMEGIESVEGHLMQYVLEGSTFLSRRPEDQHDTNYLFAWERPKVVCNRVRLRRRGWRIGAVADPKGQIFSDRFLALWPAASVSMYALAALLNSPIASAFVQTKSEGRPDNSTTTIESIPIPSKDFLAVGGELDLASQRLHRTMRRQPTQAHQLLLQIDAEILRSYDLPPVLEREVLDTFQGVERPVPFEFTGYYPTGFEAYIPLYELISPEFEEARASRLLERLIFVNDPELSETMAIVHSESLDEQELSS